MEWSIGEADYIREKGFHAWNIVSVDNTPYQLDVTWDVGASDISKGGLSYDYFLLSDDIMNRDHKAKEKLPVYNFTRKMHDY